MRTLNRISAGVTFESDVLRFVDLLAADQQRTRSFIINHIIRTYARMLEEQKTATKTPEPSRPAAPIVF